MVHLRLTGLSEDGRKLVLLSDAGVEFTVDVDDRLRAALSGQTPAPGGEQGATGQLGRQMESTLRPRDIQARIRAGESPESVAQVAGTSVDKVMPYAAPVLAERAHVAQRAQRASIRRRPVEGGATSSARTLGDAVGSHLRSRNVDPDTVSWDAWRREDGRWTLTGAYSATGRDGAAHFSFDAPGNYVVADDDDAHWLLGEISDEPAAPAVDPRDDLSDARRRRLSAVPPDELPLGDDAIELVSEEPAAEVAEERTEETAALGAEAPVEAYLDSASGAQPTLDEALDETLGESTAEETGTGADEESDESSTDDSRRHEPPARKPVKKTRGRASVPSWDEIMFGGSSDAQD
ncbi:MAG TPA: septation protein SepH [Nocardioides sp.]|jgi:hypothetical protein|nr:septation protein SepH [Nocardioides sp.]